MQVRCMVGYLVVVGTPLLWEVVGGVLGRAVELVDAVQGQMSSEDIRRPVESNVHPFERCTFHHR